MKQIMTLIKKVDENIKAAKILLEQGYSDISASRSY
jgi:hypothetical protein